MKKMTDVGVTVKNPKEEKWWVVIAKAAPSNGSILEGGYVLPVILTRSKGKQRKLLLLLHA